MRCHAVRATTAAADDVMPGCLQQAMSRARTTAADEARHLRMVRHRRVKIFSHISLAATGRGEFRKADEM